jgi:hypothetical protein
MPYRGEEGTSPCPASLKRQSRRTFVVTFRHAIGDSKDTLYHADVICKIGLDWELSAARRHWRAMLARLVEPCRANQAWVSQNDGMFCLSKYDVEVEC